MLENEFHFVIEVVSQVSLTRVSEFIAIVVDRAGESIVEFGGIHPLPSSSGPTLTIVQPLGVSP